jgi:hypothetical protein
MVANRQIDPGIERYFEIQLNRLQFQFFRRCFVDRKGVRDVTVDSLLQDQLFELRVMD